jgi:hypothetical protein
MQYYINLPIQKGSQTKMYYTNKINDFKKDLHFQPHETFAEHLWPAANFIDANLKVCMWSKGIKHNLEKIIKCAEDVEEQTKWAFGYTDEIDAPALCVDAEHMETTMRAMENLAEALKEVNMRGRKRNVCAFFNSKNGCSKGDECRFRHEAA